MHRVVTLGELHPNGRRKCDQPAEGTNNRFFSVHDVSCGQAANNGRSRFLKGGKVCGTRLGSHRNDYGIRAPHLVKDAKTSASSSHLLLNSCVFTFPERV